MNNIIVCIDIELIIIECYLDSQHGTYNIDMIIMGYGKIYTLMLYIIIIIIIVHVCHMLMADLLWTPEECWNGSSWRTSPNARAADIYTRTQ